MALSKVRLGDYLKIYRENCGISNLTCWDVSGVNKDKEFFEPAKQVGEDTSNYKIVPPDYFACNLMHIGRDVVLPIALNRTRKPKYVSPAYTVFYLTNEEAILKDFLFIYLNSSEKDRFFWFHCDGSVRDGMDWNVFCDMEIKVPPIEIQQKYVNIYQGMVNNQKAYERGLEDLKLVCDGYMEDLRRKLPSEPIGKYLSLSDRRNDIGLGLEAVRGISTSKEFIETKADMEGVGLANYKLVQPNYFAYVGDTSRRGDKISLALNTTNETFLVSSISYVFTTSIDLLAEYLMLFFSRDEFNRYARFNSWGSARESFNFDDMCNVKIPIPAIEVQKSIADIFKVYNTRKRINEQLKAQIKDICPILIKGSIDEARR
mgnify:CR=1 FL=1